MNSQQVRQIIREEIRTLLREGRGTTFTLQINCDNDSFHENLEGELGKILQELGKKISQGAVEMDGRFNIRDSNGNTVGNARIGS